MTHKTYLLLVFILVLASHLFGQTSSLIAINNVGHLTYKADEKGNVIPDFSGVGYQNSEVPILNIPLVLTVNAVYRDNVANVQDAINTVAAMPVQANGFRGAILFTSGLYKLSSAITLASSGIVLREEGTNTIFKATGTVQYDLINVKGVLGKADVASSQKQITDAFVPIGAKSVTVHSGHTFQVGDWVHVRREPNAAWISLLGMDLLASLGTGGTDWTPSTYKVSYERKITNVVGNVLTFDAPIMDLIDPVNAKGFVVKFTSSRIEKCAVKNMKMTSAYTSPTDELHEWKAINMNNITNAWVKNVIADSFGYSCVSIDDGASFVTVEGCSMLNPISIIRGGRRYSFVINGQRSLLQNCTTKRGRHDFVDGSRTPGTNVFYNCRATIQNADMGPHHRWSSNILFDNIIGDGQLRVQNRVDSGSGHGWSGSQIMFWNCTAAGIVVQDPPSYHRNWAIGCIGPITNIGKWTTELLGVLESNGTHIAAIPSLFLAQLNDRLATLSTDDFQAAEFKKNKVN